ncbi:MAG: PglZ domain-containing protein [Sediminibacterium sp.]
MAAIKILWVDDEIESLQSQIIFLQNKGYEVMPVSNGFDAIEQVQQQFFDAVLMDESMPGISGLQTMMKMKEINKLLPIVLITRNDSESLMDEAIGSEIADYLIKPVNPQQVLLSLKKIIDNRRLVAEKTTSQYQQQFSGLLSELQQNPGHQEWMEIYRKLVFWEMEMEKSDSPEMRDVFFAQKQEANRAFARFVSREYMAWLNPRSLSAPIMSHHLFALKVLPHITPGKPVFFVLIDNLRLDQWKAIEPLLAETFRLVEEDTFYSILPTATQYARNAIFSGLLPVDIQQRFPELWKNDEEEGGKNLHETEFLQDQLKRLKKEHLRTSYHKITQHQEGQHLVGQMHNLLGNDLNVVIYNFVDTMSHARTEMEIMKELAYDETSYRSLTRSWFEHSPLYQALKKLADKPVTLILATDHGSVRVKDAQKVVGDRQTTTNLRYKHGRNLQYNEKEVLAISRPQEAGLPAPAVHSTYIFAREDAYLCYPNHFHQYAQYYKNTFQHGGISLEEMIIPVIRLESRVE